MIVKNTTDLMSAGSKIYSAIAVYGKTAAKKLESEAKSNAAWTDRTANARNSIQAEFKHTLFSAKIILSGNVDYFVFLELANEMEYAILRPTIEKNVNTILSGYEKVIN